MGSFPFKTFVCWLTALSMASHGAASGDDWTVEVGRRLAETNCEPCHAIGRTDRSTISVAPPFRDIAASGRIARLEIILTDNARMAHEEMPQSRFGQKEIEALTAYLESLTRDAVP